MTAKRIRKNAHKKIAAIFSNSTTAKAYAEDNGFVGVDVSIEWVKKMAVGRSVEYYDNQNGSYTIRIHSNLWYELYHSNYEVLKKIRESEEPIKVTGLVGEVADAYDKAGAVTAKKLNEFNEILAQIWAIEERVKALEVLPNWEQKVKRDILTSLRIAGLGVGDFIQSTDETVETETVPIDEWLGV